MTNLDLIKKYCIDPTLVGRTNNLSCSAGTLYSYAEPITRYLDRPIERGTAEPVFLISLKRWSVTTSRHQNTVIKVLAVRGVKFSTTEERLTSGSNNDER